MVDFFGMGLIRLPARVYGFGVQCLGSIELRVRASWKNPEGLEFMQGFL